MKKIFTFLMAFALFAISAQAVTVNVVVDNPDAVTVRKNIKLNYWGQGNDGETVALEAGTNAVEVDASTIIKVTANEGWLITEAITGTDTTLLPNGGSDYSTSTIYSYSDGNTYEFKTVEKSKFRDSTFTLRVDDPTAVKATLGGTYEQVEIPDDATEISVPFSAAYEKTLTLSNPQGGKLYKIIADGREIPTSDKAVKIDIAPGIVVEVMANFPDIDIPVHFTFTNPGTEGFLTLVEVDGEEIDPEAYLADDFTVKAGSRVTVDGNSSDYEINRTEVNGYEFYLDYSSYTWQVTEETTFTFDVTAYATIEKKVIVDGADHITFYRGYSWDGDVVDLHDGENIVSLRTNDMMVAIEIDNDYYFAELTDDGEDMRDRMDQWNDNLDLSETGDLVIVVKKIVKDKKFVMFIDDIDRTIYFSLKNGNNQSYDDLESGYNVIEFYDGDGDEWYCNWSETTGHNQMFVNDEENEGYYGWATQHYFTPADNDVVRVYLGETPDKIDVVFNVEEGAEIEVKRDILTPVDDLTSPLKVYPATRFNIVATGDEPVIVAVGNQPEVEAESHEFTADAPVTVTVRKGGKSALGIITDTTADDGAVYNMMGVKVADKAGFDTLPKGIYIIGGRKVSK